FKNSPFIRFGLPAVRAWRRSSSVCSDGLLRNRNSSILAKTSAVMTESLRTARGHCATSPPHAYPCTGPGGERFSLRSEGGSHLERCCWVRPWRVELPPRPPQCPRLRLQSAKRRERGNIVGCRAQ